MSFDIIDQPPTYNDVFSSSTSSKTTSIERSYESLENKHRNCSHNNPLPSYEEAISGFVVSQLPNEDLQPIPIATTHPDLSSSSDEESITQTTINSGATVQPYQHFSAERDVFKIRSSLESFDRQALIDILCNRTEKQRIKISQLFKSSCGQSLTKSIDNNISSVSDFALLMSGLVMPFNEFMAQTIYNSTSLKWMCFLVFVIPASDRIKMKNLFEWKYGQTLNEFLIKKVQNTKKTSEKTLVSFIMQFIETDRHSSDNIQKSAIVADINVLKVVERDIRYKELADTIIYTKSFAYLKVLRNAYEYETKTTIEEFLKTVYDKNSSMMMMNIFLYAESPYKYFAHVLKTSIKGLRKNEILLRSVVMMRSEIDMVHIKRVYDKVYNKNLKQQICDSTSGYYKYALLKLIGEQPKNK